MAAIVIEDLTIEQRLELIDQLWESLDAASGKLSAEQLAEIDRRAATADEDAQRGKTWAEIRDSLPRR